MATNKKTTKGKTIHTKDMVKKIKPTQTPIDNIAKLVDYLAMYVKVDRNFKVGDFITLEDFGYSVYGETTKGPRKYKIGVILSKPSLFDKYKSYRIAYISSKGNVATTTMDKEDIVCRFNEAPDYFQFY